MRLRVGAAAAAMLFALPVPAQVTGLTGTLVVTNKQPFTASIIDVGSGRLLATLPTGRGPHEVVLSSDGRTAVVTDYGTGQSPTLTVIDVPRLAVARTISLGEYTRPHGIVYLPGDSTVVVTSESTNNVVVVNVLSGNVAFAVGTQHAGSHMVGVTRDGKWAYTGDMGSHTVTQLDLSVRQYVRSWTVPEVPEAINVTPDGKEVWVGSNRTGKVTVLDPVSGAQRIAAEGVSWPYRVLFSPDMSTVVIPDMNNNELRFLDRASHRELSRIAFPNAGPQGIIATPDGRHVFLSLSRESRVAIVDLRSRQVVGYLAAGATPDGVAYTPLVVAR